MELSGKKVIVVGLGKSGLAALRFLGRKGARLVANDSRDRASLGAAAIEAEQTGAELVLGGHPAATFREADLIVVSPGVPPLDAIAAAEASGVETIGEIELAARFIEAPIVAVTGTNGKSTVTTLIGDLARHLGRPTFVGGNLGQPLIEVAETDAARPDGLVVAELSSFQLERVSTLKVHVAVLLNISDDHLDRYGSFADYAAAKARIFERQDGGDYAVVSAADPALRALISGQGAVLEFGAETGAVRLEGGAICDPETGLRVLASDLRLRGTHNLENACAAALVARIIGVTPSAIAKTLREFEGLPHRMQYVGTADGVDYIDDSKATNVGAAVASIEGLTLRGGKVVLIAGGVDKGGSYRPLRDRMESSGRAVVVLGEAAPLIEESLQGSAVPFSRADTMGDAVHQASGHAEPGDIVLLAPACSSFDMFRSYAERGEAFQHAVAALGGMK